MNFQHCSDGGQFTYMYACLHACLPANKLRVNDWVSSLFHPLHFHAVIVIHLFMPSCVNSNNNNNMMKQKFILPLNASTSLVRWKGKFECILLSHQRARLSQNAQAAVRTQRFMFRSVVFLWEFYLCAFLSSRLIRRCNEGNPIWAHELNDV